VKSNWLTFVGVGSLGLMAALGLANGRIAPAGDDPTSKILGDTTERRQAQDLLRQATAALRANRLDEARKLATHASDLNATYSLFDVRPEHILAEVERREQSGGVAPKPATAAAPEAAPAPKPTSALTSTGDQSSDPFAQTTTRMPAATTTWVPARTAMASPLPVTPTSAAPVPAPPRHLGRGQASAASAVGSRPRA
jgi:hypothetical protein